MKSTAFFCVLFLAAPVLRAHDVITTKLTYTRDISRILARRCVACHSSGDSIPLTAYGQVRPWAVAIKQQVLSRSMPPWGAVKGFGDLSPDRGLTQEELLIIAAWVIGGAPEGNPALLPHATEIAAAPSEPALQDASVISTRSTLDTPLRLAGIRPIPESTVNSARIVARFPDGRVQPLLWLFGYDPKWKQTFRFRELVSLPRGTAVFSDEPLRFALEITR